MEAEATDSTISARELNFSMDPISVTASILGIVAAAASTARAFEDLRRLCKTLPGRLHALSNEVSDIELVLHQVASVVQKRTGDPALEEQEQHIKHLLDQAASKLCELRTIVQAFTDIAKTTKIPFFQAYAWRKNQPRLQVLQEDIKTVKCSLNIMLGASNSQDMMRIRVDLDTISTVSSNSAQIQRSVEENLQNSLIRHRDDITEFLTHVHQQADQRISSIEELLKTQAAQLHASQLTQLGNSYGRRAVLLQTVTAGQETNPARGTQEFRRCWSESHTIWCMSARVLLHMSCTNEIVDTASC